MTGEVYEYQRAPLYPKQLDAIFCPERYAVIEASTKCGKTYGCTIWLTERTLEAYKGANTWWVAPVFGQAKIAYRRLKRQLPRRVAKPNDADLTLYFADIDVTMWFKSADNPDTLYGDDVIACVMDESTRCKPEAWYAVRSTLSATKGPVRIIGNVKGRKNWAYQLARKAQAGAPNMHYAKITALDAVEAGVLDAKEIEDARSTLPEGVFRELYLAEPSDDGGNPFGLQHIAACVTPSLSSRPTVAFGLDLAKSVDYTVLLGLDAAGCVSYFDRWKSPWNLTIKRVQAAVGNIPCLVDSTGVGDPIFEQISGAVGNARLGHNYEQYVLSQSSKQRLMEGLAVRIQKQEIRFPDGVIRTELDSYEYVYTRTGVSYSAPDGQHDDCVIALALASQYQSTHATDALPYAWMRRDPVFRASVLGDPDNPKRALPAFA